MLQDSGSSSFCHSKRAPKSSCNSNCVNKFNPVGLLSLEKAPHLGSGQLFGQANHLHNQLISKHCPFALNGKRAGLLFKFAGSSNLEQLD